jgi:hypothetical protein
MRPFVGRLAGSVVLLSISVVASPRAGVDQAAGAATPACSITWVGQEAAIEEFMRTAPIARLEDVPIGVTKPRRAVFAPGGPAARAAWKALPPRMQNGYRESYKAEIAAYHLDRLLDLGMVPPVVERTIEGRVGALLLWIENAKGWDADKPPRGPEPAWSRKISRMKLFDQLIANIDRNQGNLIYDADWHLFLIDHSRAFTDRRSLDGVAAPTLVDKPLWDRIDALTAGQLQGAIGAWLSPREIEAMLIRRDRMRTAIERMVKQRGEAAVFLK